MTGALLIAGQSESWVMPATDIDAPIEVPSGQLITLQDVIANELGPEGLTLRFRFLAPAIARDAATIDNETATDDMMYLCQNYALPRVLGNTPLPSQIIVSLSDRPVDFGVANPEATQFFEAYSLDGDACIWEAF